MAYHKINTNALADQKNAPISERYSGSSNQASEWLSMKPAGDYTVRIAPPWSEEGTPARKLVLHQDPFGSNLIYRWTNEDGEEKEWNVSPLCLDYVFANENIARILVDQKRLSSSDYEKHQDYGCPLCILARNLQRSGQYDRKVHAAYWGRSRYIFNVQVIDTPDGADEKVGELYKWGCSTTAFEDVEGSFARDPLLFDPVKGRNLVIEAKFEKSAKRRYNLEFLPDRTPFTFSGELHDLDDAMAKGVKTFDQMVSMLEYNRTEFAKDLRFGDLLSVVEG